MDSSGDDFEDDPFNYQPLKRRKLAHGQTQNKTQTPKTQKKAAVKAKPSRPSETRPGPSKGTQKPKPTQPLRKKVRAPSPILSQKLPNVTKTLNDLLNNTEDKSLQKPKVTSKECPMCQLPLHLLSGVVTSTNHLAECAETSFRQLPACPAGVHCVSRVVSHYARYDHSVLTRHRDLGLSQTTRDISPGQLSDKRSPKISDSLSTTQALPRPKFSSTRIFPSFTRSDIFDEELQDQIENAIQCVNNDKAVPKDIIEGESEEAGPSGINNNRKANQPKSKSNLIKVVIDDKEVDVSLEPSLADPNEKAAHPSPIKVSAEKDSQELELSLNIDPGVHCTKLRLRVPLKKTESGQELPVQVSANYSEMKSPAKQAQITEYFRNGGGGGGGDQRSESPPWSDIGVVRLNKAKEDWNKIFSRAKAKGYLAPTPDSSQEKVVNTRKETVKKYCPWYKKITDTVLAVDAFNFGDLPGIKHYLLSHFHYDHYIGLTKAWRHPIVSSSITKRLATSFIGVKEALFTTLDPGESRVVGGCEVTAVDANHCPGSVMFVIRLTSGVTLLHVGDCRACHSMEEEPVFWNTKIDKLYLDTTYCKPEYDFPSQSDVISRTVELVGEFVASRPDTVVMVGAYTVGKERIFKAIASGLEAKVWGDTKRVRTWRCLEDSEILGRLVGDRKRAQVQVIMNQLIGWPKLGMELDKVGGKWNHVLGVKPTGWTHSRGEGKEQSLAGISIVTRGHVSLLEVPYSEHSSYSELKRFVQYLRIGSEKDIIPTVNVKQKKEMSLMFKEWIEERKAQGPESQ